MKSKAPFAGRCFRVDIIAMEETNADNDRMRTVLCMTAGAPEQRCLGIDKAG